MATNKPPAPVSTTDMDPTTTPSGKEPQSDPSSPLCAHAITPSLAALLPNASACPACTVARHIANIKDVQNVLRTRGGVFFSRGRPKTDKHRALMDRWRQSKVQLLNLVSVLETSVSEHPEVRQALSAWEEEKECLAKVPGYVYEGDEVKLSTEVASLVDGMLEELKNSIVGLLLEDGPEVVMPQRGAAPEGDIANLTTTAAPSSTAVSITVPEEESVLESSSLPDVSTSPTRSCLKRKLASHETPRPRKHVRTADFVTISSEHSTISNPSPFLALSTDEPIQSHSPSTAADRKRRKGSFSRSSESYVPGRWASPAFCSKPNTSCFKLDWDEVEELWMEEEEEVAEEKRVHERLRVIAEVHLMCWWVRSVASLVGIEKVLKIGSAVAESREAPPEGSDGVA